jgi:MFS family permease
MWGLSNRQQATGNKGSGITDLDLPGALLLGVSLVCLTVALTDDPIEPRSTAATLLLYAGAAAFFGAFLLRQARAPLPILNLQMFRRRRLSSAFAVNVLVGGALIVAMVSVPLFTNIVLRESALQGGINLMRLTIALPLGALAGGAIAQRYGASRGAWAGLICAAAGFFLMGTWTEDPGFLHLTGPLLLAGLGFGLVIAPINSAALDETPEDERATMASLLTVVRLLGALVGVALLTSRGLGGFYAEAGLISLGDPRFEDLLVGLQVDAFREVFIVTGVVCLLTLLPAAFLGRATDRGATANDL